MLAVEVVGIVLIVLGVVLLAGRVVGSESDVQIPGVTIKAPASVLVLVLGVLVFLFPYSPWWPETASPQSSATTGQASSSLPVSTPTPTPTPTTTPAVTPIVDAIVDVPQTYLVDVDTGTITVPGGDLWFEAVTPTERYLTPQGGAMLAHMGSDAPGLPGCVTAAVFGNRIPLDVVPVGDFLCLRTASGRIAEIQLVDPIGPSPGTMRLHIRTFAP